MAELLIRIVDKGPDDLHSKAGEVITAQRDGWSWTQSERSNPHWVILRIPGLDADRLTDLSNHAGITDGVRKSARFDVANAAFSELVQRAASSEGRTLTLTADEAARLMATKRAVQSPKKVTL